MRPKKEAEEFGGPTLNAQPLLSATDVQAWFKKARCAAKCLAREVDLHGPNALLNKSRIDKTSPRRLRPVSLKPLA
jgi:hypothetical protein